MGSVHFPENRIDLVKQVSGREESDRCVVKAALGWGPQCRTPRTKCGKGLRSPEAGQGPIRSNSEDSFQSLIIAEKGFDIKDIKIIIGVFIEIVEFSPWVHRLLTLGTTEASQTDP